MTVDNVTEVMELVSADKILDAWKRLGVQESVVKMKSEYLATAKEKTQACVEHYLNFFHDGYPHEPSWYGIADALYKCREMTAA